MENSDELLLVSRSRRTSQPQSGGDEAHGGDFSWLTALGFVFLTFNSGMAVYRSNGDIGAISFVAFSYLDLVALFLCLRLYESTPPESPRREHLKMAVWLLTTMLTAAFSYKVAAVLPLPVVLLVWAMAAATGHAGFFVFFRYRDQAR
nr:unnamed protein product [Digitaria exilis]